MESVGSRAWKSVRLPVVLVALAAVLVTCSVAVDSHVDRKRPMYHDQLLVAGAEWSLLRQGEPGVTMDVDSSSDPVTIGKKTFRPQDGVEVTVTKRGTAYCVRARNQHGDGTGAMCITGKEDKQPSMGILASEKY